MAFSRQAMDEAERLHLQVLGRCLKQRRLARGLSQSALAGLSLVSRGQVQHAEHGRHSMREGTKFRLCVALGISIPELDAEVAREETGWPAAGRAPGRWLAQFSGGARGGGL